jgi:GT2 family glycosyltransferase
MAIYQNVTRNPIRVIVKGARKTIKPGQFLHGSDNLSAIPGLILVEETKKTIIPIVSSTAQSTYTSQQQIKPMTQPEKRNNNDLEKEINEELSYLYKMMAIGHNPSVTIAILTKNALKLITDCCESIFSQVNYSDVVLMIADTGTTEQAVRDYYNSLPAKCAQKNWKFQFVQLPHFHYSSNYNRAIDAVVTDYVLIQNNDTVALSDYVSEMMYTGVLRRVGSTGCRMLYPDRASIQHDGQTMFNAPGLMFGSPSHVNLRRKLSEIPENESHTDIVDGNTAAGALMRVSDYKTIGGFDEHYKDIFQDVDMMIKIPHMLQKYNYCNKEAVITHIDNASRLASGHDPKRHAAMWEDTNLIKNHMINNNWMRGRRPREYDFSVITLVRNIKNYEEFCHSLKKQLGTESVEVIAIPNFFQQFTSVFKALNIAADTANGRHLIFCHEDIIVPPDWILKIKKNINELEQQHVNWGVLGPAGVFLNNNNAAFFLYDVNGNPLYNCVKNIIHDKTRYEIESLDELCLITKKSNKLRFSDKQLSGFHFYGVNLCLDARLKGYKNFAIDAYCYHKSDGYKNISTPEKYKEFENYAKLFNIYAQSRGITQWRSTTAMGNNGVITLFTKSPEEK